MTTVTFKGNPVHLEGNFPKVGSKAPAFTLVDSELQNKLLKDFEKSPKLLLIVPSLETSVCATCAREFNKKLTDFPSLQLLVISADLPFAQKRYAAGENMNDRVIFLSMMRDKSFAKDYGVFISEGPLAGLCSRAVLLLSPDHTVLHAELVSEITKEPSYEKAFQAL